MTWKEAYLFVWYPGRCNPTGASEKQCQIIHFLWNNIFYSAPSPFFRFFWAVESMSLMRLSWLTSLAPGS